MMCDPMAIWAREGEWKWWNFNLDNSSNELLIALKKNNKFLSFIRRSHLICLLPLGEERMDQRVYTMFPARRAMLCWLQRNPCDGVRCELFEQCLGSFLVSLPSEGRHPALPQLGRSPCDRLCNASQLSCLVWAPVSRSVILPTGKILLTVTMPWKLPLWVLALQFN